MKGIRELWARWTGSAHGRRRTVVDPDDPALRVVVESFDEAEAASAALARATRWQPDLPAVLRHHLALPDERLEAARALLTADGWQLRPGGRGRGEGLIPLVALRVQKLDALHCSQETSRMAGLAQRHDGRSFGWDALQPG